jgi:hypothetical protein
MSFTKLGLAPAIGLVSLSDLYVAQYKIVPPAFSKKECVERQSCAINDAIESEVRAVSGQLITGRALLVKGGTAMQQVVDITVLFSRMVDAFKVMAGRFADGREGFIQASGQFSLNRAGGAVASAAVDSLIASLVLEGTTSTTAHGKAGVGVVHGPHTCEKPVNQCGSIGEALDRSAFRAAPDVLNVQKERLSGLTKVDITSRESSTEQHSIYDRLRRESAINRYLGKHRLAREEQADYIAAKRAEMHSGYKEQNCSVDQRSSAQGNVEYNSPSTGGFDTSAATNALRRVSADLQARLDQQTVLQQKRKQFTAPRLSPSPVIGRSLAPWSGGEPSILPTCSYYQTPC